MRRQPVPRGTVRRESADPATWKPVDLGSTEMISPRGLLHCMALHCIALHKLRGQTCFLASSQDWKRPVQRPMATAYTLCLPGMVIGGRRCAKPFPNIHDPREMDVPLSTRRECTKRDTNVTRI
eukprot:scaffold214_cov249-Pinguiococcus_pyrenoidosus.AAC.25